MAEQYPLFVPDKSDPCWGSLITCDPEYAGYIWLVPPQEHEPWVQVKPKRVARKRVAKRPEDKTKLKKVDVEQLRSRSGFVCEQTCENPLGECLWVCYDSPSSIKELDLKVAKRLFKPNKWTAIQTKNRVKLNGRLVPLIPIRYYQKVSESAKWNKFLTQNLAGNILIANKIPSKEYVEGEPKFIPFDPNQAMTTPAQTSAEYKFDLERLTQQNMETAGQEPLFKLLSKLEPKPPTTPTPKTYSEVPNTPGVPPKEASTENLVLPAAVAIPEPEKPTAATAATKKRRAPSKPKAPGGKRTKVVPSPPPPASPSSIVLSGIIPAQPNHATDANNKSNILHLVRKIREHPKYNGSKKNPLSTVPVDLGSGPADEETKKMLLMFAHISDFYLQGELGLQAPPPSDTFLDSLFE